MKPTINFFCMARQRCTRCDSTEIKKMVVEEENVRGVENSGELN